MKKIIFIVFISLISIGCRNEIEVNEINNVKEGISSKGGFDLKPFYNATLKENNAKEVRTDDFSKYCNGVYKGKNGIIKINNDTKTIKYNTSNKEINGNLKSNIVIEYNYVLKSASENLVYLMPENWKTVKITSGLEEYKGSEMNKFNFFIPMYGFGEGRIEVSNHIEESMIDPGTYWKN